MTTLSEKQCQPCRRGAPPLTGEQIEPLLGQLDPAWEAVDEHHLARTFRFPNFAQALGFVNRVGELAEQQGHHPDIFLAWGRVRIELCTHKIDGLTESDFVMAAKIDQVPSG